MSNDQITPDTIQENFKTYEPKYDLRRHTPFANRPVRKQKYGAKSLAYLAPRI